MKAKCYRVNKKILLAIDARPLARGTGGIQRYLERLLPHFAADDSLQLILYSDHPIGSNLNLNLTKITVRRVPQRFSRSILWHFWVCRWASLDKPDIFWSPRHHLPFVLPKKTKSIVTIHDFVWKTTPTTMPKFQLLSESVLMPLAIKAADHIICISKTTQKQLATYFPLATEKSNVILHGNDKTPIPRTNNSETPRNYFLAVGSLEPRKNYERLINGFDLYAASGGLKNLVLIGKNGWHFNSIYSTLNAAKFKNRIKIHNNVSDLQLAQFYNGACGFISPSLDEGYGLPPQEAMQYGLPLILSNIDVYRELYPSAQLWIDPYSEKDIAKALEQSEKLTPKSASQTSQTNRFTWRDCAKELIATFD